MNQGLVEFFIKVKFKVDYLQLHILQRSPNVWIQNWMATDQENECYIGLYFCKEHSCVPVFVPKIINSIARCSDDPVSPPVNLAGISNFMIKKIWNLFRMIGQSKSISNSLITRSYLHATKGDNKCNYKFLGKLDLTC